MKTTRSFRLPAALLRRAKALGLNLNQLIEKTIEQAVGEARCPTCKQRIKK